MSRLLSPLGLAWLFGLGIGCSDDDKVVDKYGMSSYCHEIYSGTAEKDEREQCLNRANSFPSATNVHRTFTSCYSTLKDKSPLGRRRDFLDCIERASQFEAGIEVAPIITACDLAFKKESDPYTHYTDIKSFLDCLETARYFRKEVDVPTIIAACDAAFDKEQYSIKCLNLVRAYQGDTAEVVQKIKKCSLEAINDLAVLCLAGAAQKAKEEKTTPKKLF